MQVSVPTGRYVVAVSGGVDSVVLLDLLASQPDITLVVAHFDHGIRPDSAEDAAFVEQLAQGHGLPFISERIELGADASEATARQARYDFLRRVQKQQDAAAIITAHHQDDLLETAILNMMRGTGRLGLTSLKSTSEIHRPLLDIPKKDILAHAARQKLSWREDTTNHDERYARNYVRHRLLVRFNPAARQQLLALITRQQALNTEIDELLASLLVEQGGELNRAWFTSLTHSMAKEVMASWLRGHDLADFDRQTIERLTVQAKTRAVGAQLDIKHGSSLVVEPKYLALRRPER